MITVTQSAATQTPNRTLSVQSYPARHCNGDDRKLKGNSVSALIALLLLLFQLAGQSHPVRAQEQRQLLITELYYDTPGEDGVEEWFEITNRGDVEMSLDGYKIGDEETPGGGEGMVRFPDGALIQARQSIVVAQTATAFRALFGMMPDYEITESDPTVPDMLPYSDWAVGDIALNNDGDELLLLGHDDAVLDAVSYGKSTEFLSPSVLDVARGQSIARVPGHCDSDSAGDWQPQNAPTPGAVLFDGECAAPPATDAGEQRLPIGAIQGSADSSPMINKIVHFEGIVTGLLEDRNTRGAIFYTLFVQEIPGNEDGDPLTSDAIAVFHGARRPNYLPGDVVSVSGQVTEFYGFTEIDDSGLHIRLLESGRQLPPPVTLQPEAGASWLATLEQFEAMRVALPEAVVVGPTFSGCGFAVAPGVAPQQFLRRHLADDVGAIVPVLHTSDVHCGDFPQVKSGDQIVGLQGPLIYHFDQYKIVHQFASELQVTPAPLPQIPAPPYVDDAQISVATFNLHDFFDEVRDTGNEAEPLPSPKEIAHKQGKLVQTIAEILGCPTILAVQEVENARLLGSLAQALISPCGFNYAVAHQESVDARGIDLALLVNPGFVQIASVSAQQACSPVTTGLPEVGITCAAGQDPLFSRPPLRVALQIDGEPYTVLVIHFKSKREGEEETAPRRMAQAEFVAGLVSELLAEESSARVIVLGDFNDYEQSAPMTLLTTGRAGLVDASQHTPQQLRYSYNFGGISQLLDTILLSPSLASRLLSAQIYHVNADFPAGWASDTETPFRSSDHDIPLVVLDISKEQATGEAPTAAPETATPTPPTAAALTDEARARTGTNGLFFASGVALTVLFGGLLHYRSSIRRRQ